MGARGIAACKSLGCRRISKYCFAWMLRFYLFSRKRQQDVACETMINTNISRSHKQHSVRYRRSGCPHKSALRRDTIDRFEVPRFL